MAAFEIRDLSFTYPNENKPALDSITLSIPEGRITLICGASGSGKSTSCAGSRPALPTTARPRARCCFSAKRSTLSARPSRRGE